MIRNRPRKRNGVTTTELVVAATLLVSVISLITPLTVRMGRIWQDARQIRLALGELSNQMERLTSMNAGQRETAIASLSPSIEIRHALPEARLHVQTIQDEDGTRLVISLQWKRAQPSNPISLEGWVDAQPHAFDSNSEVKS